MKKDYKKSFQKIKYALIGLALFGALAPFFFVLFAPAFLTGQARAAADDFPAEPDETPVGDPQENEPALDDLDPLFETDVKKSEDEPAFEEKNGSEENIPDENEKIYRSFLTGLPMEEQEVGRRPVAVVINNLFPALPQSGISQADVIYESLAEGNITRLVAIFQVFDAPKIGPVRSARDYFIHYALDFDAIFVHHGYSPSAYDRFRELGIDRLDGLRLEGSYYWRDRTYPDWDEINSGKTRSLEHSSYTSAENIRNASAEFGFRETVSEDERFGFAFNPPGSPPNTQYGGGIAEIIDVQFSREYARSFTYDPETRLYAVFNRDGPHIDALSREQLRVTNILIQSVKSRVISGDAAGRRDVQTIGSGMGYLVTQGGYVPARWEKEDHFSPTRWYFANGEELRLNIGRTWICVLQDSVSPVFEYYD
ncbi:MAG: DUF3048 domain-containing protein [Defluviitaleaceae bacterium]|nr:DUF3048 domain-containing protein [Defluviitaleaceae bacterium]